MAEYSIYNSTYTAQQIQNSIGKNPRIGERGNWEVWDVASMSWVDTGVAPSGGAVIPATTNILKGNGAGGVSAAVAGTDFAPAGYGLGGGAKLLTSADDLNDIWQSGLYQYLPNNAPANAPPYNLVADIIFLFVQGRAANAFYQEIVGVTNGTGADIALNSKMVRARYGSTYQGWSWVNPPMLVGVEYRTTERYLGKPVYVKAVEITDFLAQNVARGVHYSSTYANPIDYGGYIYKPGTADRRDMRGVSPTYPINVDLYYNEIYLTSTTSNWNTYKAKLWVKYTKQSEE